MSKEMAGIDYKVGEVQSSFGEGNVDVVMNMENAVSLFARRYCIPDAVIYKNELKLKNNPIEAAKHVEITDSSQLITDTETAVVAEIAKLQTAEENLKLSPKQKEVFQGVKENQKGALAFISSMAGAIKDPEVRRKVISGTVAGLEILGLAGCAIKGPAVIPAETAFPTDSPIVEVTDVPGVIEINPTNLPVSPTETQVPIMTGAGYPTSSENFILNSGGSDEQSRQRIIELGAGGDLKALEDIYKAELTRTGKNPANYSFEAMVWEGHGKVFWDSVIKDASGHYLGMKLTKGSEAGQVVRAFGLTRYLLDYNVNDDFFEFFTLQNSTDFPDAKQQMVWDKSGWHVVGLFTADGSYVGWFNADTGVSGEWEVTKPTPTPITEMSIESYYSSKEELSAATEESYKNYIIGKFGEWGDTRNMAAGNEPGGKWTFNMMVDGKYISFIEKPLHIPIADDEDIKVFVATTAYYLDKNGELNSVLLPVIFELPEGTIYSHLKRDKRTDWKEEDIPAMYEALLNGDTSVFHKIPQEFGNVVYVVYTDLTAYWNYVAAEGVTDTYSSPILYLMHFIEKYNNMNQAEIDAFINEGGLVKFLFPEALYSK